MPDANGAPWSLTLSEVGKRLEELRERRDLTQAAAAQRLREKGIRTDTSALSRIETGKRRTVPRELVEALLDLYRADTRAREHILGLLSANAAPAGRRRRPALWRRHAALLGPMQFEAYLQLEPRADLLRNYELALVPGPHQTEEYAFHSIASMRPELSPAQVRGLTDVRMDRQQKIAEGPLREFQALIEEQALRRMVGDRNIMRGQLEHLVDASEDPRNSLRVLAESLGCHPGLAGGFMLMRFPEATPDVVWLETMNRTVYFDEEADVDCYVEVFSDLWGRALDPAGTRARLTKMIKEL